MLIRLFLSSPNDVNVERAVATHVINTELPQDPILRGRLFTDLFRVRSHLDTGQREDLNQSRVAAMAMACRVGNRRFVIARRDCPSFLEPRPAAFEQIAVAVDIGRTRLRMPGVLA